MIIFVGNAVHAQMLRVPQYYFIYVNVQMLRIPQYYFIYFDLLQFLCAPSSDLQGHRYLHRGGDGQTGGLAAKMSLWTLKFQKLS